MIEYIANDIGPEHPADTAYTLLQKMPSVALSHVLGTTMSDNSGPVEYLAYLQDIRNSLLQAKIVDGKIYADCKNIIETIERVPSFFALMAV